MTNSALLGIGLRTPVPGPGPTRARGRAEDGPPGPHGPPHGPPGPPGPPPVLKAFLEKAKTVIGAFVHPGAGGPGGPGPDAVYGDGGGIRPLSAVAPFSLAPLAANGTADNSTVTGTADSMLANVKAGNSSGVRAASPVFPRAMRAGLPLPAGVTERLAAWLGWPWLAGLLSGRRLQQPVLCVPRLPRQQRVEEGHTSPALCGAGR